MYRASTLARRTLVPCEAYLEAPCVQAPRHPHHHPSEAQQRRASDRPPVDTAAQLAPPVADEHSADLALDRAWNLVTQAPEQNLGRRLGHLDRDVADETVGDDHVGLSRIQLLGLDVAPKASHRSFQPPRRLPDELIALAFFLAI